MARFDLQGGVAVVTGAGSGIGRATALALAARGCHLALVDRDDAGLAETARQAAAEPAGVHVTIHALDVTDGAALDALPSAVRRAHGGCTVLVNNAGVALVGRFDEVSMDEWRWLFEINVFAVVRMTQLFLPLLREAKAGHVVNVSSLFGLIAPAEQAPYAASKFAVRGLSESLRHELEGTSVGLTVVHPGGVRTAISQNARIAAGASEASASKNGRFERLFLKTPPEAVGSAIARAVERRKGRLVVADGAKPGSLIQRLLPGRYWQVLRRLFDRLEEEPDQTA